VYSRIEAVAAARRWIGTPYILKGRVRGAGCDCATLLAEYLIEIGAATSADLEDLGFYSDDWFCNTRNERYLRSVIRFGRKVAETVCRPGVGALPGDLVLFRVVGSRVFNHGAIITSWPRGIHAQCDGGVREVDLTGHPLTAFQQMDIFNPFATHEETAR
jgi:cell wall-associated NlpC family hydrolase